MAIYIKKNNQLEQVTALMSNKTIKSIYVKQGNEDAVCVWGVDLNILPFTYTKGTTSITITGLKEGVAWESLTIPETIEGLPVTQIASNAFKNKTVFKSIELPNSLKGIGSYAFYNCNGLTSITIPDSVTSIGESAFRDCTGLTSVTIPNSVTSINESVFRSCTGLTSITIGNSVTSIGRYAFYNCFRLTSITIPDSVTSIGIFAFGDCTGLASVTIGNSVTSIGNSAFDGCSGLTRVYYTGDIVEWCGISGLGYLMNYGSSSKTLYIGGNKIEGELIIPNTVTSIGSYAFSKCAGLTSVIIPLSVTSIRSSAFRNCVGLTSVITGHGLASIGDYAFEGCYRLVEVYNKSGLSITAGSSSNGYIAYYAKNVYTYDGGSKLSTDGNGYVTYTDGDEKILVAYCGTNTELILPSYITQINIYAFRDCIGLTSVTIPNSVTSIDESAFRDCTGLVSVTIGNSVTNIGLYAFYGCSGLVSVTIGNNVTKIGDYAFYKCTGLTSIIFKGTKAQWNAISKGYRWNDDTGNYTIHCTDGDIPKQ
nr:MAG TPA: leucine-rich repeat protein [Caudoviricetes sp.]